MYLLKLDQLRFDLGCGTANCRGNRTVYRNCVVHWIYFLIANYFCFATAKTKH